MQGVPVGLFSTNNIYKIHIEITCSICALSVVELFCLMYTFKVTFKVNVQTHLGYKRPGHMRLGHKRPGHKGSGQHYI